MVYEDNIIIRKAVESDAEKIEKISLSSWIDTYRNILSNDYFKKMEKNIEKSISITKKKIDQFYVIENNEKLLGFSRITEINNNTVEINALYLDINEKQKEYGKKLLYYIFNNKYKRYIITVFKDNSANIFYKKMGGILTFESTIKLGDNEYPINIYEFNI